MFNTGNMMSNKYLDQEIGNAHSTDWRPISRNLNCLLSPLASDVIDFNIYVQQNLSLHIVGYLELQEVYFCGLLCKYFGSRLASFISVMEQIST